MKFIEFGTQEATWAAKTRDPKTGLMTVDLRPVVERYFRIYLPWKRLRYVINVDDEVRTQPCWGIYWHSHPNNENIYFARWAWQ